MLIVNRNSYFQELAICKGCDLIQVLAIYKRCDLIKHQLKEHDVSGNMAYKITSDATKLL